MIISKKKYEKLNNDLVDAKAKVDDAKKELDDENKIMRATLLIKEQRDQLKTERDTLIDDLSWYKAKVSKLERDNEQLKESRDWDYEYIIKVNEESKRLKREKEEFQRKLMAQLEVNTELRMNNKDKNTILSEISQHIGNKPSSSTYKYFRAKLDDLDIKENEQ